MSFIRRPFVLLHWFLTEFYQSYTTSPRSYVNQVAALFQFCNLLAVYRFLNPSTSRVTGIYLVVLPVIFGLFVLNALLVYWRHDYQEEFFKINHGPDVRRYFWLVLGYIVCSLLPVIWWGYLFFTRR